MDAVEKAIRNALEKGDADQRSFREAVYRKAFAALERAIENNPGITAEMAERRRAGVTAKITEIESEFIPAVRPVSGPVSEPVRQQERITAPPIDVSERTVSERRVEPSLSGSAAHEAASDANAIPKSFFPNLDDFGAPGEMPVAADRIDAGTEGGPNVPRERRRPFAILFLVATVIAVVAIGAWWAMGTGLLRSADEIDTSVPNPPAQAQEEDYIPEDENNAPQLPGAADVNRSWITVFSPADPTVVTAPGGTSADVMEDEGGAFIRIRSGATGDAIVFDVGQGTLEQLAGKHAVFNIVARSEEGKDTQFAVDCNFGELGDCGRKRYAAGYAKGDFLFEIEMPDKAPGAAGTIAINSDITKSGKALDIYQIRVSTAQ